MRTPYRSLRFFVRFAIVGLALAFVLTVAAPSAVQRLRAWIAPAPVATTVVRTPPAAGGESASKRSGPVSYADAVNRAAPAVVNIYANRVTSVRSAQYSLRNDPLTQRLLGVITYGPTVPRRDQNLGSGVIFSADGYVLTNNHVINGADEIQVLLDDGRVAQATVVGADADTDLAVLKIDVANLPTIAIAEGTASVGDVVLAIGNPFGIGKTVTMGIVSATGRQLRMSAYEDFIQTDAAINLGNSGGALVNAIGELVGINAANFRQPSNGAEGIGFAIPVNTAKAVLDQIVAHGAVVRGWLGADYSDLLFPQISGTQQHGVVLLQVYPGSPAALAELQKSDVLLKLDGIDIVDQADFRSREAALAPGSKVTVSGVRAGAPFTATLTVAERPRGRLAAVTP